MVFAKRRTNCLIQKKNWHYYTEIIILKDKLMETTFDKFITNNTEQKSLFDKEYAEFLRSERALENLDKERKANSFVVKSKIRNKEYMTV